MQDLLTFKSFLSHNPNSTRVGKLETQNIALNAELWF